MQSPWQPLLFLSATSILTELCPEAVSGPPHTCPDVSRVQLVAYSPALRRCRRTGHTAIVPAGSRPQGKAAEVADRGPGFIHQPRQVLIPVETGVRKVTLSCEAHGNPRPVYRWFRDGSLLELEAVPRYRLVGGSLIIEQPRDISDAGSYQCLASNAIGSILSREGRIRFTELGNFSEHSRGAVSIRAGQGVVLLCAPPSHTAEVSYSWVFNAFPIYVEEDSRRFVSQVTGNLHIARVQASDVGSYLCLLKDLLSRRKILSPATPLTLRNDGVMGEYEPKIEVHFPAVIEVAEGSTANLECFALGNPVPTITWRKLNGILPSRARLRKSQAILEVLNIQREDSGTYECKVENTRGGSTVRGELQVYTRPYWSRTINNTRLDNGQQLRWECRASGRPRPTYRWLKNGELLTSQERLEIKNGLLTIPRVGQSDAGMYQCVAENRYGAVFTGAQLDILASAPSFAMDPVERVSLVAVGQDLLLTCNPQSSPKASISWTKDNIILLSSR
ncbi:contactin-5-like [Scyliorhinus torazame]|uniref:contactin-5-like n=1 Tax=Scyliorhinus torazame TaxID=75743 RepID=UPI003B5CC98B